MPTQPVVTLFFVYDHNDKNIGNNSFLLNSGLFGGRVSLLLKPLLKEGRSSHLEKLTKHWRTRMFHQLRVASFLSLTKGMSLFLLDDFLGRSTSTKNPFKKKQSEDPTKTKSTTENERRGKNGWKFKKEERKKEKILQKIKIPMLKKSPFPSEWRF